MKWVLGALQHRNQTFWAFPHCLAPTVTTKPPGYSPNRIWDPKKRAADGRVCLAGLRMLSAGTYAGGAASLSLGLSVPETLAAQALGAIILALGLTMNAAAG